MQPDSSYHLDSQQMDEAIAIVESELEVLKPLIRINENSAPWVKLTVYGFFTGYTVISILFFHRWISSVTFLIACGAFFVAYGVAAVLLSWRQFPAMKRLRQTQRSLGLPADKYVGLVNWKELKWRLAKNILTLSLLFGGCLLLLIGFYFGRNRWLMDAGLVLENIAAAELFIFALDRNLLLSRTRLEASEMLRAGLIKHRESTGNDDVTTSIPEIEYKEIARIERAVISLERQRAIKESAKRPRAPVLAVQQSAAVIERKATLDPPSRIRVQSCIDELSTNPYPSYARASADGNWQLLVPETQVQISYAVADNPKRILVQDVSENLQNRNKLAASDE